MLKAKLSRRLCGEDILGARQIHLSLRGKIFLPSRPGPKPYHAGINPRRTKIIFNKMYCRETG
jgi:hypothetical protein